jgi:hypothetical protein
MYAAASLMRVVDEGVCIGGFDVEGLEVDGVEAAQE